MLVIFQGDPIEHAQGGGLSRTSVTIDGVLFPMGQAVDASALSPKQKEKLGRNPHFEVLGDAPAFAPPTPIPADEDGNEDIEEKPRAPRGRKKAEE